MRIIVTTQHIGRGTPLEIWNCPLALALCELTGGGPVSVSGSKAYLVRLDCVLALPECAREFVHAFDSGEPVAPFEFDLDLPGEPDVSLSPQSTLDRGQRSEVRTQRSAKKAEKTRHLRCFLTSDF